MPPPGPTSWRARLPTPPCSTVRGWGSWRFRTHLHALYGSIVAANSPLNAAAAPAEDLLKAQYAVRGELYMKAMELQKAGKELIFTNGAQPGAGQPGKGACCRSSGTAAAARTAPESTTAARLAGVCPTFLSMCHQACFELATAACVPCSMQWATRSSWASCPSSSTARCDRKGRRGPGCRQLTLLMSPFLGLKAQQQSESCTVSACAAIPQPGGGTAPAAARARPQLGASAAPFQAVA